LKLSIVHHTASRLGCLTAIAACYSRILAEDRTHMVVSGSFDKIRMTRRRPKGRYIETLEPVIPKISESAIVEPLNLVQAKFNAKQWVADIRCSRSRPTFFSTIVPSSATKGASVLWRDSNLTLKLFKCFDIGLTFFDWKVISVDP